MSRLLGMLVLLALATAPAAAQQLYHAETSLILRRGPSNHFKRILVLETDDDVLITGDSTDNGWVPVRTLNGDSGYVGFSYLVASPTGTLPAGTGTGNAAGVIGLASPVTAIAASWSRPATVGTSITMPSGACDEDGEPGGDAETNRRKNRNDEPAGSHAVTFATLRDLPYPPGLPRSRASWTAAQRTQVAGVEGVALTVTGFFAAIKPQRSNREDTNCDNTGEDNTDWHVALVGTHAAGESRSVVVEPTPRFKRRHPNWRTDVLAPWVGAARSPADSVRVTGWLFYDPSHANHLGTFRATMWELHPVTRIEVFQNGAWVNVDDLQ